MKELLMHILSGLVSKPEAIQIEEIVKGNNVDYKVKVDAEDLGSVIGKGGRIANSIRTVVRSSAKKEDKRVNVSFDA